MEPPRTRGPRHKALLLRLWGTRNAGLEVAAWPSPLVRRDCRWYGTRLPLAGPQHRPSTLCLMPAPPTVPQSQDFGVPPPSKFPPGGSLSALRARLRQSRDRAEGCPREGGKAGGEKEGRKKPPWLLPESETNKLRQQNINMADWNGIDLHSQLLFPLIYELPSLKDYSNHGRTV